jgi:hypothetical protein
MVNSSFGCVLWFGPKRTTAGEKGQVIDDSKFAEANQAFLRMLIEHYAQPDLFVI